MNSIEKARNEYLKKHGFEATPLKAVLFDMDGVLFDSMPMHGKAWKKVSKDFGLNVTPEDIFYHEGRTAFTTINFFAKRDWGRTATDEEIQLIYAAKCREFNSYPKAKVMPGAQELLTQILQFNIKVLCVTGSGQNSLLERLYRNFPNCFVADNIVSSKDCKQGKPSPEPYLLGLDRAGVEPYEAIVVENAPLGIQSSVCANIFTIAVNSGPLPNDCLIEQGANLLYSSMEELSEEWKNIESVFRT